MIPLIFKSNMFKFNDFSAALHTNSLHSILHKIGHIIQIVVHQFVRKTSAKKIPKSEKNWSPLIPGYAGIRRNNTKEKKIDPL
jgi:hypothetical protein